MTVRIALLTGCIIVLILTVTVVAPRVANDRSGNANQHPSAQASPTAADEHSAPHADHAAEFDVAGLLTTDTQSLRFCVASAMQPYEAVLQQIEDTGASEAATRFARCLLETMLYHAPDATVTELNLHHDHFAACFAALIEQRFPDPAQAADGVNACVAAGQH